jgi:hypothetical protein
MSFIECPYCGKYVIDTDYKFHISGCDVRSSERRSFLKTITSMFLATIVPISVQTIVPAAKFVSCMTSNHTVLTIRKGRVIGYVEIQFLKPNDKIWSYKGIQSPSNQSPCEWIKVI